ncbi:MAG: TonB-dependent receptor [Pseudomonadota bacterium]
MSGAKFCLIPLRTALMVSATALAVGAATAQDTSEEELREDKVTVYGTSNPIPVFDYPGQVTVVSRDELDLLAPSTIADALRDVPGLDFSGGPRRTGEQPALRGLSGQNVLILLDGARQSFTSAHDGRFFVDPELVGSVEVVRGPASALYGSGAVGGVLALESVDAGDLLADDETMGGRVRLGYHSVNEEVLASVTGYTQQGGFDGLASFGIRQSSDITLGSGADLPSDDEIETALLKGSYAFTDAFTLEGSWQRFGNTAIEPNNGQGTLGTGDSILDRTVEKDITTDTFRLGATFNPDTNDWVNLTATAYQTTSEVDEFDATIPRTTVREIETTGFSARNASRFMLGNVDTTLTVGGDWYKDEQTGVDDQTADGTRGGVPDGESEFTGLFAQIEAVVETPAGEFLIIPGVRFDEFESSSSIAPDQDNSDDAVSPRFAASFEPAGTPWLRVFGSYSEGFRAPSINELYLDGVHFPVPHPVLFDPAMFQFVFVNNNFIPNPDLVPEETETLEFGAGVDFADIFTSDDRLQAKLSYFETEADNLINLSVDFAFDPTCFAQPTFFPCTAGTSESSNVAQAELEGWEGELRYEADRWFATASYSSIKGTDLSDGSDLGSLTPDRLALNTGFRVPSWQATFGTRVQMADDFERRGSDGMGGFTVVEERAGYVVLDVYASWEPSFADGLRFDVGIDNLLDHDYDRVFQGVSEPGQNIKIAASYQFGN